VDIAHQYIAGGRAVPILQLLQIDLWNHVVTIADGKFQTGRARVLKFLWQEVAASTLHFIIPVVLQLAQFHRDRIPASGRSVSFLECCQLEATVSVGHRHRSLCRFHRVERMKVHHPLRERLPLIENRPLNWMANRSRRFAAATSGPQQYQRRRKAQRRRTVSSICGHFSFTFETSRCDYSGDTTSSPARVTSDASTRRFIDSPRNRTAPSAKAKFAPPLWKA